MSESPWLATAARGPDPTAQLSATVERIRAENNLDFVVVMDTHGIRWTHPNPEQLGHTYTGSITDALQGVTVVEETLGTLGSSIRVVAPITSEGRVVALVAAGY